MVTIIVVLLAILAVWAIGWLNGRNYVKPEIDPKEVINDPATGIRH